MHGLTGGSWKRSHDRATATEMNNPTGNRAVPMALRPTADQGHRASSRPSIECPREVTFRLRCARWRYPSRMAAEPECWASPPSLTGWRKRWRSWHWSRREKVFHDDSYGYRPGRSPLDAIAACRKRCWEKDWVVDLDVKAFFDTVSWDLTMKAVTRHTDRKWVLLYVERWLKAPMQMPDGTAIERTRGTPQGGPISPLLANLFLHYGFDLWISREYPGVRFERFADDAVIHCVTERQAWEVRESIGRRFADIGLSLHPEKTKIVYCKDSRRHRDHPVMSFTFCGYAFRPRKAFNKAEGRAFTRFLPAVDPGKLTDMSRKVASWKIHRRTTLTLNDLARGVNPALRGWLNYFTVFYPSMVIPLCWRVDRHLMHWARRKYKRLERGDRRARAWLCGVRERVPRLFAHWELRYTTW